MTRKSPASFSMTWKGLQEAADGLEAVRLGTPMIVEATIRVATKVTHEAVQAQVNTTKPGVRQKVTGTGSRTKGRVYLAGGAFLREMGASAHPIAANKRLAMHFGDTFARRVSHPGARRRPFFAAGVNASADDRTAAIQAAIKMMSDKFTKTKGGSSNG